MCSSFLSNGIKSRIVLLDRRRNRDSIKMLMGMENMNVGGRRPGVRGLILDD
jgi:hypothetical protein